MLTALRVPGRVTLPSLEDFKTTTAGELLHILGHAEEIKATLAGTASYREDLAVLAGHRAVFEILANLDFDRFPDTAQYGEHLYEIMIWHVYPRPCRTKNSPEGLQNINYSRGMGRALLATTETTFRSKGRASLPVCRVSEVNIRDRDGFDQKYVVFKEALTADISEYAKMVSSEVDSSLQALDFEKYLVSSQEVTVTKTGDAEKKLESLRKKCFRPFVGSGDWFVFQRIPDGVYEFESSVEDVDGFFVNCNAVPRNVGSWNDNLTLWSPRSSASSRPKLNVGQRIQVKGYYLGYDCGPWATPLVVGNRLRNNRQICFRSVEDFRKWLCAKNGILNSD